MPAYEPGLADLHGGLDGRSAVAQHAQLELANRRQSRRQSASKLLPADAYRLVLVSFDGCLD